MPSTPQARPQAKLGLSAEVAKKPLPKKKDARKFALAERASEVVQEKGLCSSRASAGQRARAGGERRDGTVGRHSVSTHKKERTDQAEGRAPQGWEVSNERDCERGRARVFQTPKRQWILHFDING